MSLISSKGFKDPIHLFWADILRKGCTVNCVLPFHCIHLPLFLPIPSSAFPFFVSIYFQSFPYPSTCLQLSDTYFVILSNAHFFFSSAVPTRHSWHCQCHMPPQYLGCNLCVYLYLAFIMINSLSPALTFR